MAESNAQPSGENAGENQPNLSIVPSKRSPRPTQQPLTRAQQRAVAQVELNAVAAQVPPYKNALEQKGIEAAFLTTLLLDIKALPDVARDASGHSSNSEVATRDGHNAEATLVADLRQIQAAGRQLHQHSTPEKLQDYLIGEDITKNRAALKAAADALLSQSEVERGPGIDTDFINKTAQDLEVFKGKNKSQLDGSTDAQTLRHQRDEKVASIVERGITIKTAADRAWPYSNPANAGPRRKFGLPERRPYVPSVG